MTVFLIILIVDAASSMLLMFVMTRYSIPPLKLPIENRVSRSIPSSIYLFMSVITNNKWVEV